MDLAAFAACGPLGLLWGSLRFASSVGYSGALSGAPAPAIFTGDVAVSVPAYFQSLGTFILVLPVKAGGPLRYNVTPKKLERFRVPPGTCGLRRSEDQAYEGPS